MKRVLILLIATVILLSSCSFGDFNMRKHMFLMNNNKVANESFEKIIVAIQNQDSAVLKALFSKVAQSEASNLGENSIKLFKFIQGDIVSFSDASEAGVGVDYKTEQAKKQKIVQSAFYLETSAQKYYIAIRECIKDDFDNNNVGVISIYIIKSEDWDEDDIYRGDGKWTPGINIME